MRVLQGNIEMRVLEGGPVMAEVTIQESLWKDFVVLAQRRRRKPAALAETALREYIQRIADEELDAAMTRAARRAKFRLKDTEEIIRQYRREKAKKAMDGRAQ